MSFNNFFKHPLGIFVVAIALSTFEYGLFGQVGFLSTVVWIIFVGRAAGHIADVIGLKKPHNRSGF